MELEELKAAWSALDARVSAEMTVQQNFRRELTLDRTRGTLRSFGYWSWWELTTNGVAVLLVGSFLGDHIRTARFAIPALVLHIALVLLLASTIWQITALARLDYTAPVVTLQRRLAEVGAVRARTTRWTLLLCLLLWTPFVIVAAYGLLGLDLYRAFGPLWVAANLVFGAVASVLMVVVAHRYGSRLDRNQILGRLSDDIAGRRLSQAIRQLDEIAQFEEGG